MNCKGIFVGFFVEVYKEADTTVFYLYHRNRATKDFMIGVDEREDCVIRRPIENNVEQYIGIYIDAHFDKEESFLLK